MNRHDRRKAARKALSPVSQKVLDAMLLQWASSAGVLQRLSEDEALESMHALMDAGLIRIESDGDTYWLIPAEEVTIQ